MSTQDGSGTASDTTTTATTLATSGEATSTSSTTGFDGTTDSATDSAGPCSDLIETFDACPGRPWVASHPALVDCVGGDAVLIVTSEADLNVSYMLPVGLVDAAVVVDLGDPPPAGILKILRVETSEGNVIAYRSNGTTSALEIVIVSEGRQATVASAPYDPKAHRWLRLREDAGSIYFGTSADGEVFAAFHDQLTPFEVDDTFMGIAAGNAAEIPADTTVSFRQFEYECMAD